MPDQTRETILKTIETLLELQLRSVKQLLGEEDVQTTRKRIKE